MNRQPAAVATSKRYDMSLAPGEDSWIKFHDQRGVHRGSIVDTERGAKLESGSGDFAEWQERVRPQRLASNVLRRTRLGTAKS